MADLALVQFDAARVALEKASTIDEVKDVHDQAEALRLYFKQTVEGLEMQNQCAAIKLRAERKGGELIAVMDKNQGGPVRLQPATALPPTLAEQGIEKTRSHRWQKVAAVPEDEFEDYIETTTNNQQELTTAGLLRRPDAALRVSESNEWYTPSMYIEAARNVLGGIDLDPASSAQANEAVRADRFFDAAANGLEQEWHGQVWLNPPYGGLSADFTAKLLAEYHSGRVMEAILLVNANSTDTGWFQPLWDYLLCFTKGRINFEAPGGASSGSTHGSVFVYVGEHSHGEFVQTFEKFGAVVRRA